MHLAAEARPDTSCVSASVGVQILAVNFSLASSGAEHLRSLRSLLGRSRVKFTRETCVTRAFGTLRAMCVLSLPSLNSVVTVY